MKTASRRSKSSGRKKRTALPLPPASDWQTSDEDERAKRRAREKKFRIKNNDPKHPIFSRFSVASSSGLTYQIEIRDILQTNVLGALALSRALHPQFKKDGRGSVVYLSSPAPQFVTGSILPVDGGVSMGF